MRTRCLNPRDRGWKNYGGRGIRIARRWSDFAAFLADMGPKPGPEYSLDRIDVNGHYGPDNCRWARRREQALNRRATVYLTVNGERLPLAIWAERHGQELELVRRRLRAGWPVLEALTTAPNARPPKRPLVWKGRQWTERALARAAGVGRGQLRDRLARGESIEQALSRPSQQRPRLRWRGRLWTEAGLARAAGISVSALRQRLQKGASVGESVRSPVQTRRAHRLRWRGRVYPNLAALAREAGMTETTLRTRIVDKGMSVREAVYKATKPRHQFRWRGRTYNVAGLARATGMLLATLYRRLVKERLSVREALALPTRKYRFRPTGG